MKVTISSTPAQSRQIKQRLASPEDSLSYELGQAVRELPPLYTRLLAGAITVLAFGTIAWAYFSKVDEVAVAQGELIPSNQVRPIRALNASSIQQILVKEGQTVQKGDVLIEMNAAVSQAEIDRLENSAKRIQEDIARLEAERAGTSKTGTALQDSLLAARLKQFQDKQAAAMSEADSAMSEANRQDATIKEGQERLLRLQENLANAKSDLVNSQTLLKNAQEREKNLSTLESSGAVPNIEVIRARDEVANAKSRLNEAQDKIVSLEKELSAQVERVRQAEEAYQSARSKVDAAQSTATGISSERQSEILTQLSKRQEELTSIVGQLEQAKKQRDRETVTAPYDGTVYNLKATRGPAQPGEELLSVLPQGEKVLLEVKVLNRDIGFIRTGQEAKVKLATFPYQEFGIVSGEVIDVSPNAITEKDENGQSLGPVFPTRIRLSRDSLSVHGKEQEFTPGMVATGEIVTRKKSILTFLIEPVTRRFSEAFSVR